MTKRQQLVILLAGMALLVVVIFRSSGGQTSAKLPVPKLIFFVTIDTLRADHLQSFEYPRETAPFIDSLAKKGVLFTSAYSAAPHTAPSHATMFTALFPFQHNLLRNHEVLDPRLLNLASYFEQHGYRVAAIPAVGFLDGKVGFKKQEFPEKISEKGKKYWYKNAREIVDQAIWWIGNNSDAEKSFVWLHFYDVHQWAGKGNLPKEYRTLYSADDGIVDFVAEKHATPISFFKGVEGVRKAMNGYDRRLRFVDDELKRLSSWISQQRMEHQALWVITSDHGEGLGNHEYEGHGKFLYQEQLHIPLIVFQDIKNFPKRKISDLVRSVDLFPTLADLAGIPLSQSSVKISGVSLAELIRSGKWGREPVKDSFAERRPKDQVSFRRFWEEGDVFSLHSREGKYIEHTHGVDEYFDLISDPFELKNLSPSTEAAEEELKSKVNELFSRSENAAAEPELKPSELEELKSLGYL